MDLFAGNSTSSQTNCKQKNLGVKLPFKEELAFASSKKLLTSSKVLAHFDPKLPIVLLCDTSSYGIGAVLAHKLPDGSERPVGYVSRHLSSSEANYSQKEKEGLACVFGVKKFHAYLYGYPFILYTDHLPLKGLFQEHTKIPVPCLRSNTTMDNVTSVMDRKGSITFNSLSSYSIWFAM